MCVVLSDITLSFIYWGNSRKKLKLLKYNNEIFIKWISKLFYKMRKLSSNWFFFWAKNSNEYADYMEFLCCSWRSYRNISDKLVISMGISCSRSIFLLFTNQLEQMCSLFQILVVVFKIIDDYNIKVLSDLLKEMLVSFSSFPVSH